MRELMVRVKVLLRRGANAAERTPAEQPLSSGDLVLDPLRFSTTRKTRSVALTVAEFLLLQALVARPGIVETSDQLMSDAYPDRVSVSDRTIDSHVKRIRRKLQAVDPEFDRIEAVYGAGYRFLPQA